MNRRIALRRMGIGMAGLATIHMPTTRIPMTSADRLAPQLPGNDAPIRLSSNENPYGPSPMAIAAMTASVRDSNRYHWDSAETLISAIARKNNVVDKNVLIAAGSTEILNLIGRMACPMTGSFVVAQPSYTGWTEVAEHAGLIKIAVPLTGDKRIELPAMQAAIRSDTRFVYICNPNNPTGTICDTAALSAFVTEATKRTLVVLDEAYIDFSPSPSLAATAAGNKNLIVVKTFSKMYGLAGARIGYAIAHADTIDRLGLLQSWANSGVSVVSRAAALASLKDDAFVYSCFQKNEQVRKFTSEQLSLLNIKPIPSYSNFIYFSLAGYPGDFFERLKTHRIAGTGVYEKDGQWTRITVGTMAEMQRFIAAIQY